MTKQEFQKLVKQDIIILDGATGSNLMKAGMPRGVCTEKWICENPEPLTKLQRAYRDAGSQVVYAPTFSANAVSLENHGLEKEVRELNLHLVDISRKAVGDACLVAGDVTTTGKQDMPYEQLLDAYKEQIDVLLEAGVDLLVAETMLGVTEPMAVLDAATGRIPVMCTLTVESDGSLFFGGNIYEAVETLEAMGADAVGINCSTAGSVVFCCGKYQKENGDSFDCKTKCRYAGNRCQRLSGLLHGCRGVCRTYETNDRNRCRYYWRMLRNFSGLYSPDK